MEDAGAMSPELRHLGYVRLSLLAFALPMRAEGLRKDMEAELNCGLLRPTPMCLDHISSACTVPGANSAW